jgi:hypothetical protein
MEVWVFHGSGWDVLLEKKVMAPENVKHFGELVQSREKKGVCVCFL